MDWHFMWEEILAGAIGGLCYTIFKDEVTLPVKRGVKIYLGVFRAIILGAFVAFVVDTHPVLCALMGFSFNDVIISIQRRMKNWTNGNPVDGINGGEGNGQQTV